MPRFLLFLLLLTIPAAGQVSTANVFGTVQDATTARISGAGVDLISAQTGFRSHTTTNEQGAFFLPSVFPGTYTLQVNNSGFATVRLTGMVLNIGDTRNLLIRMKVSPVWESVVVDASELAVNTTDAAVSTVIDHTFVQNVPLSGRSFNDLISGTPGIVTLNPQSVDLGQGSQGELSVNGQTPNANYYTVDGISGNINSGYPTGLPQSATVGSIAAETAAGTTQGLTSLDELDEFRVSSSTYSAEYGRTSGGQFSILTKSGTNTLHGSIYDYLRNDVFDANDWFNQHYGLSKSALHQNDFGATFGGPFVIPYLYNGHNRTFVFAAFEGPRIIQPFAGSLQYVPSPSLRNSTQSNIQEILNAFPQGTGPEILDQQGNPTGLSPFTASYSLPSHVNSFSARADQVFTKKYSAFIRYNNTRSSGELRQLSSLTTNTANSWTLMVGARAQFSSSISDTFRVGYAYARTYRSTEVDSFGGAEPISLAETLGNPGDFIDPGGFRGATSDVTQAYIRISGVGETRLTEAATDNTLEQWNGTDVLNMQFGHHAIKIGVDERFLTSPINSAGIFVQPSFYDRAAILANLSSDISLNTTYFESLRFHELSAFVQDEWQIAPSLSLSLGLRSELNSPPTFFGTGTTMILQVDVSPPASFQLVPITNHLWHQRFNNYAPRIGAAWALSRDPEHQTVVRAGAGVFYDSASQVAVDAFDYSIGSSATIDFPGSQLPLNSSQFTQYYNLLNNLSSPPYTSAPVYIIPSNLQPPYSLQWSTSVEQSLGKHQTLTASYVGTEGRRLLQQQSEYLHPLNPDLGYAVYYPNHLTSNYQGFQIKAQRSISSGLQVLGSYTWSHTHDYGSTDPLFPLTHGNSNQDVRHNFEGTFSWNLPRPSQQSGMQHLLANWGIDGKVSARSAFPVQLFGNLATTNFTATRYYSGVDLIPHRPLYLRNRDYPGGRILNGGPNAANPAFVLPAAGQAGNSPRNMARGFDAFQVNLAARKEFSIAGPFHVELRAEAFNLFNHPNFGYIDPHLLDQQFGQATKMLNESLGSISPLYQPGGSRSVELVLRLSF